MLLLEFDKTKKTLVKFEYKTKNFMFTVPFHALPDFNVSPQKTNDQKYLQPSTYMTFVFKITQLSHPNSKTDHTYQYQLITLSTK